MVSNQKYFASRFNVTKIKSTNRDLSLGQEWKAKLIQLFKTCGFRLENLKLEVCIQRLK